MHDYTMWIGLTVLLVILAIWFIPPLWVLLSSRSEGGAKFGWFLISVFFSWLGLAVFLIFTQKPKTENKETFLDRVEPK